MSLAERGYFGAAAGAVVRHAVRDRRDRHRAAHLLGCRPHRSRSATEQILQSKLGEYAVAYSRGGLRALSDTVRAEQRTAPERLFVRVVDRGAEALVLSMPDGWDPATLETDVAATARRHAGASRQEHRGATGSAGAASAPRSASSRCRSSSSRSPAAGWRRSRRCGRFGASPKPSAGSSAPATPINACMVGAG